MRLFKRKRLRISEEELTELEYSIINLKVIRLALVKKADEFNDSKYDEIIKDLDNEINRISDILGQIRYRIA